MELCLNIYQLFVSHKSMYTSHLENISLTKEEKMNDNDKCILLEN